MVASASAWFLHVTADSVTWVRSWKSFCLALGLTLWTLGAVCAAGWLCGGRAACRGLASAVSAMGLGARERPRDVRGRWKLEQRPWHPQRGHGPWQPAPRLSRKCGHLCSALSEAHANPFVLLQPPRSVTSSQTV